MTRSEVGLLKRAEQGGAGRIEIPIRDIREICCISTGYISTGYISTGYISTGYNHVHGNRQ
jgi:hypothetical protein